MFRHIAAFELRYQLRSPLFWATTLIFALLTFGSIASDSVRIGSTGNVKANSPYAIAQTLQVLSVFAVFIMAAFVATVVVRDDETGFGPIVHSTRVSKHTYLFGRFTGAFAVGCLAFAGVPLAMLAGTFMPWIDPETLGPLRATDYLYVYFLLCVPSLFAIGAGCFALATMTRSMAATYVGVIVFLVLFFAATQYFRRPEHEATVALLEPFGIAAFEHATRYWTATERNTQLPALAGTLLWNRVIWLSVACVLLGIAWAGYRGTSRASGRRSRPEPAETVKTEVVPGELPQPKHDRATARRQLLALVRFDTAMVFRSPAFFVLIGIGLLNSVGAVWMTDELYGMPILPVTRAMIEALTGSFSFIALIVAIYYAGELVWRDRERRMHEIIGATPTPDWAFVTPKVVAIVLVLAATIAAGVAATVASQLLKGFTHLELDKYLLWYVLPQTVDMALLAVLAVFIQVLVPNKFTGWLGMLIFIVSQVALDKLGYEHHLYQYADGPEVPLSDMNGQGSFAAHRAWFRAYWAAVATLLVVLSYGLWRRGAHASLVARLRRLPRQIAGAPAGVAAVALIAAAGLGAYIYYNTNVLNEYRTALGDEQWLAEYEKTLLPFESTPQPRIVGVTLTVDIFPHEPRVAAAGRYVIENRGDVPLEEVHLRWARDTKMRRLDVSGARLRKEYERFAYRIYRFDRPLAPGQRAEVRWSTVREQRGFRNSNNERRIVANGTFLNNTEIAPFIGMDRSLLLQDRSKRRRHGLPPELRPARLEDQSARTYQVIRRDSDWVTFDITVSTVADQLPVAPGYKISDTVADGRRTIRYRADAPMMHFFSIQSAAYAVARDRWRDVELAVYYQPSHGYNVRRMLNAMKASLEYCSTHFSPYQFKQARILEFPAYERFAQSFANTIPYSESIGFIFDATDADKIDMVTYVTAHEIAHQWWAHQVLGGDMQGSALLAETLAQYSALMVMERMYGPEQIRRFLRRELDRYLRERGGEAIEELPLERVESQPYIYYQKGSLAMYLLKDILGEEAVNRALRALLAEYAFKPAPYPTSRDLIRYLRAEAGSEQQLITDLFENITLYDAKVTSARKRRLADGKWEVTLDVEAHKLYADGQGLETEVPLAESFDIGVFSAEPGKPGFIRSDVLWLRRQPLRSGAQRLRVVTEREPAFAGVDPYNKRVDRNSEDNVRPIEAGS